MQPRHAYYTLAGLFTSIVLFAALSALPAQLAGARSDPPAGVTVVTLSSSPISVDPAKTLRSIQITFNPGTSIDLPHHPGPIILSVVSGELTASITDSEVLLTRDGSAASYSVDPGKSYTLDPGDRMTFEFIETADVLQNRGIAPLVLNITLVSQDGRPDFAFESEARVVHTGGRCISCH